jgi:O-acetyl-ADP-ribose deacetylase (regulator of RNase III)
MPVIFTSGDIFDSEATILVCPVNCVGTMGKGLAKKFRERFGHLEEQYRRACFSGVLRPGRLFFHEASGTLVICFPTKDHWKDPSNYIYIRDGLISLEGYLSQKGAERVALPALGCGLGGLDWNTVRSSIEYYLKNLEADIQVYEPRKE